MRFPMKIQSCRLPMPGESAQYVCKKCGHWFSAIKPIWGVFGLAPKCPHCGSRHTEENPWIVY
jgi:DNA-directed RNA polymerase subunit RPC12/RpoP